MKKTFIVPILFLLNSLLWGQTTVQWNFGTSTGTASPSSGTPVSNLTISDVSQGNNNGTTTMLTASSVSSGYTDVSGSYNAGGAARTGAINTSAGGSAYFEFTLTPASSYIVTLSAISFGSRSTSTGPQAYSLRYSDDNYVSDLSTGAFSNNSSWVLKSNSGLSISGTNNATPVTFRIYGYNGTNNPAVNTANWRIDDLSLTVTMNLVNITIASLTSGIVTSPLTGGYANNAVIGFSLTSNGSGFPNFTAINVQTSSTTIGKFRNIKLYKSTDNTYATSGDNTQVTGTSINVTATEIQISGFSEALSGTPINIFVVTDIDLSVTGATPNVRPSFTETNITVSSGTVSVITITGTNYAFQPTAILLAAIEPGTLNYTEGDGVTPITSTTTVAAVEANLVSGVIQITGNYQIGEDLLRFTNQNGIIGSWDVTSGSLTLNGTTSVANYQTAVRSITYQNTSFIPNTSQRTVSFTLNDGIVNSNTVTRNINVIPINNAPTLAAIEVANINYMERDSPTQLTNTITVSDIDNTNISSAVIAISGNYQQGNDLLIFTNQNGITGSWTDATGTMALSGSATLANYQEALRYVTYQNWSVNPSTLERTVSFTVNDGEVNSNTVTRNINVIPINSTPTLAAIEGTNINYIEGDSPTQLTNTITVSDIDDTNIESATIQITGNYQNGEDLLRFTNQNGITGTLIEATGTMTLSGSVTLANYQTALRDVKYSNTSQNPSTLQRTVSFTVNDGTANSNILTRNISVASINTPPVLSNIESELIEYKIKQSPYILSKTIVVEDADDDSKGSVIISIIENYQIWEDELVFNNQNGITGQWNSSQGILYLYGNVSVGNYQAALRTVCYRNNKIISNKNNRVVSIVFNDGDVDNDDSNTLSRTIVFISENIAPIVSGIEADTLKFLKGDTQKALSENIIIEDPDNINLQGATVKIGSGFIVGEDVLEFSSPQNVQGIYNWATGTIELTGQEFLMSYQNILRTVKYKNIKGELATKSEKVIEFTVTDGEEISNIGTRQIEVVGVITGMRGLEEKIPTEYKLYQNYPNPFNASTTIRYGLSKESNVIITVYNILGEEITKLVNDFQYAGFYEVNFDSSNLTSGIYIYRISAGSFMQLRKMLLIK